MARYPGAEWRPLASDWAAQPIISGPNLVILHTMVGTLAGTDSLFRNVTNATQTPGYGGLESHFGVNHDGTTWQWQDTSRRAEANGAANADAISIETVDTGGPFAAWTGSNVPAWTSAQVDRLADIVAWACQTHNIPCSLVPDSLPGRRGIAYHRQGIDPWRVTNGEVWSSSAGKVCPGDRRVAQVPEIIAKANAILNGTGTTSTIPAPIKSPKTGVYELPGFDCSFTKPGWVEMQAAGYKFVIGYVSSTPSKNLTSANITDYRNAGMGVGLVWQQGSTQTLGGSTQGSADGAAANSQANALGYPNDAVIFFAVDFDAVSSQFATIQAYANAFNAATTRPVGIYGGYDVIEHFVTPGVQPVRYGWQTTAWSEGQISLKAHILQRVPTLSHPAWPVPTGIDANSFDENVALLALPLHGWQNATSIPPPGPDPQPAPDPPGSPPAEPTVADKTPPGPDPLYIPPTNCTTHVRSA